MKPTSEQLPTSFPESLRKLEVTRKPMTVEEKVEEIMEKVIPFDFEPSKAIYDVAITTGSHAYGTPFEDSDLDLILFEDTMPFEIEWAKSNGHILSLEDLDKDYRDAAENRYNDVSFYYAKFKDLHPKVNLIICHSLKAYECWVETTLTLRHLSNNDVTRRVFLRDKSDRIGIFRYVYDRIKKEGS